MIFEDINTIFYWQFRNKKLL